MLTKIVLKSDEMKKIIANKFGRPQGDIELRKLRSQIWYKAVKSVDNLNDSKLDVLFGSIEGQESRVGDDRIKMFEAIRVNKSIPSNGKNSKRNFDLVARVDAYPRYRGTAAVMHSPLWRLLEKKPLTVEEIREIVLKCITNLDSNYDVEYIDSESVELLQPFKFDEHELFFEKFFEYQNETENNYYTAMVRAFSKLEYSLDYIALLAALTHEAVVAGNMAVAVNLIKSLRIILKEYCAQEWLGNSGGELYKMVLSRIGAALNMDNLKDLPSYITLISKLTNANDNALNSPVAKFLQLHEQIVWRKNQ